MVGYITEKVILQVKYFHFQCYPHATSCMCANRYLDGYQLCLLCLLVSIQPVSNITEKVIYKYNLSLSHIRSCMCENHYMDGYPLCLLWYTILGSIQKVNFLIEIFYELNDITFTVILMFHLPCVQIVT